MNLLDDHLKIYVIGGHTRRDFARELGISQSYLSEIASGAKRPSLNVAFRIERETEGKVPASSWITTPSGRPKPSREEKVV